MIWWLDFSVKAALLLCATWVTALLLRRSSADVRHRLWLTALIGITILAIPVTVPNPVRIVAPVQFAVTSLGASIQAPSHAWSWPHWPTIWTAGIIVAFGRILAGIAIIAFWTRAARRVDGMLVSAHVATPVTWGVFRPVILFPAYVEEWSAEERELALRHERAHVVRRDWMWQMLASAITAVFWFHPLVWLASSQIRREAESAADDLVLASGADAPDYAAQLVRVARRLTGAAPLATVPMVRRKILESRVRQILDPLHRRSRASISTRAALVAFVCACILPLLAMQEGSVFDLQAIGIQRGGDHSGTSPLSRPTGASGGVAHRDEAGVAVIGRDATRGQAVEGGRTGGGAAGIPGDGQVGPQVNSGAEIGDAAIHKIGEPGMQAPRVLYKQEPSYTDDARATRVQGTVTLSVVIDEQGSAEDIQVTKSLDAGLDEQAIVAVQRWKFAPALKDGAPVRVAASIEVNFRLL